MSVESNTALHPAGLAPPGDDDLWIIADTREERSGIPALLKSDDLFAVQLRQLSCADYLACDLAIERKSGDDFQASLQDGRLFRQMLLMRRSYRRRLLIVEGLDTTNPAALHERLVDGALIKITTGLQTPVLFSRDAPHTARLIRRAAMQLYRLAVTSPVMRPPRTAADARFQQRYMLLGIPQIGISRAEALLRHFGSLAKIFAASVQELEKAPGIGRAQARRIRDLLDQESGCSTNLEERVSI